MTLTVLRTYSPGDFRFRYNLFRDSDFVARILSDTEARYALVTLTPTPQMTLMRDASEISRAQMEDKDTYVCTIQNM